MGHIRDRWKDPARKGKGKRWQVRYRVDGRQKDGGSYDTRAVAQRKLIELEAAVQRGQWVDPTDQTIVADLVRRHQAARMHRPRTAARAESYIVNHVEATPLGRRRAAAVRPSEAQAWVTDRAQHLAPLTLRNVVLMVRAAFRDAVHDRVIAANPFDRVTLPRVERERIVPLTVDEVLAIADAIDQPARPRKLAGETPGSRPRRYRAMVVAQAGLGLRIGELLALRVEDVDFLRRTVRVQDQIDRVTRERVPPKTPRSRRTIPLPDVVAAELARHIAEHPPAPSGLLFHTAAGLPLAHDYYGNKLFVPAAERAGAPAGTTTHALRHHYASVLLAAGQSVVAVAELLGHENAALVLSTYGHLMPGSEDVARRLVDAAWSTAAGRPDEAPAAQGRPG